MFLMRSTFEIQVYYKFPRIKEQRSLYLLS
ncbi:hypothetical protein SK3146_01848 [Paenibacillus konkukensis]|uniref:Uncharacterized protein n=1 Tax=Paenibacillus konkukensis TaxID=2020716 RepID=A0ABY4RJQ4_9BACL|nr:hypothetical protein SK3146_01848 [Paenibacillus konkukensis]